MVVSKVILDSVLKIEAKGEADRQTDFNFFTLPFSIDPNFK